MFEGDTATSIPKEKLSRLDEVLKMVSNMVRKGYCAETKEMTLADLVI